jgi:hypothetical protein
VAVALLVEVPELVEVAELVGELVNVRVEELVALLEEVLVGVAVGVLLGVAEKVGVQVWPEPSAQTVLVTVNVKVEVGATGPEGLLLLEGQPMIKKEAPTRSEKITVIRNFIE